MVRFLVTATTAFARSSRLRVGSVHGHGTASAGSAPVTESIEHHHRRHLHWRVAPPARVPASPALAASAR